MLRITRRDVDADLTVLELEGRLHASELPELERAVEESLPAGRRLVLDLGGVAYVDAQGARRLAELRRRRVTLAGCSLFVRELLKEVS
jgi:anti-anti-sigma regulatory factor